MLKELWLENNKKDCSKWIHYFDIYERHLNKFVGKPVTYLEIGVQRGGCLSLMKKYLGEQARIIGIDIDSNCNPQGNEFYLGSQEDPAFLYNMANQVGGFDIILDDGGHTANQQVTSFFTLFPFLRDGGVYIVEDLHCSQYWVGYQHSNLGLNFIDVAKGLSDKLSLWHMREDWFHNRYNIPVEQRDDRGIKHNNFAANSISSVCFYDSLIAIEKNKIPEPYQDVR